MSKSMRPKLVQSGSPRDLPVNRFLQDLRIKAGLTRPEAAKLLGHSSYYDIANFEQGRCEPSVEMAVELCELYGGSKAELYEIFLSKFKSELREKFEVKSAPRKRAG